MSNQRRVAAWLLWAALVGAAAAVTNPLAGLPALPKIHHSYPLYLDVAAPGLQAVLHDYARITGAVAPAPLWSLTRAEGHAAARIAVGANATVDLNYSPWVSPGSPFPPHVPPTYDGPEEAAEMALYDKRLRAARRWVETEGGAAVGAVLLDQERWNAGLNASWAAAVTRKNNLYYNATTAVFPNASIQLYGRGGVDRVPYPLCASCADGWWANGYYSLSPDELGDVFATSLYTVPEVGYTRAAFNRTVANARAHGKRSVTPWIALGCGWARTLAGHAFDLGWNYDYADSWQLGREANVPWFAARPQRFAEWGFAREAAFYPSVFDPRTAAVANSSWRAAFNHFVMYVRGAAGIKDLTPVA
jgi:hypothetical protein